MALQRAPCNQIGSLSLAAQTGSMRQPLGTMRLFCCTSEAHTPARLAACPALLHTTHTWSWGK